MAAGCLSCLLWAKFKQVKAVNRSKRLTATHTVNIFIMALRTENRNLYRPIKLTQLIVPKYPTNTTSSLVSLLFLGIILFIMVSCQYFIPLWGVGKFPALYTPSDMTLHCDIIWSISVERVTYWQVYRYILFDRHGTWSMLSELTLT